MSKLYATATSEKASKGQGGNEFLEIEIKNENQKNIMEINIKIKNDIYLIDGYVVHPSDAEGHKSEQYFRYEVSKR